MKQKYCLPLYRCHNNMGDILLDKFAIYLVDRETLFHFYVKTSNPGITVKLDKKDQYYFYLILKG